MKVLVCGDGNWNDFDIIRQELSNFNSDTIIIHGAAKGADSISGYIADELGFEIKTYPAEWNKYGKAAGPIRNKKMLDERPDLVLAFHSNIQSSKGTKHMIKIAKNAGVNVKVIDKSDFCFI